MGILGISGLWGLINHPHSVKYINNVKLIGEHSLQGFAASNNLGEH